MIYNIKKKLLYEERRLTDKEDKLLKILSCNEPVSRTEIRKKMNWIRDEDLDILVMKLRLKGIDIEKNKNGYELFSEIYFE